MSQPKIKVYVSASGGVAEVFTDAPSLVDVVHIDWDDAKEFIDTEEEAIAETFEDGRNVQEMLAAGELY